MLYRKQTANLVEGVRWGRMMTDVESEATLVHVFERWCKGCGICVEFCPKKVLVIADGGKAQVAAPEKCSQCGLCELMCPDFAIIVPGKHGK
jgi:2-oxoglutarate ferredoxin oxidoreductase subunit delta